MTSTLWSVDPGKKSCALAVLSQSLGHRDWTLTQVSTHEPEALERAIVACGERVAAINTAMNDGDGKVSLVVEMPERVHRIRKGRTGSTAADMIAVARAAEGLLAAGRAVKIEGEAVAPNTWKGSSKKPPHHCMIWAALSPAEREAFASAFANRRRRGGGPTLAEIGDVVVAIGSAIDAACLALAQGREPSYRAGWTHALDAVGLGLWKVGRIDRAGNRRTPR